MTPAELRALNELALEFQERRTKLVLGYGECRLLGLALDELESLRIEVQRLRSRAVCDSCCGCEGSKVRP